MTITTYEEFLPPAKCRQLIDRRGDKIFGVTFRKRTDDTLRSMTCRRHVSKGVKGNGPPRDEEDRRNNCLTVYEMATGQFKRIPLDRVIEIR